MKSAVLVPHGWDRAFVRSLLVIGALAAQAAAVSAQSSPATTSTTPECHGVMSGRAGFVEQCGDQLRAWSLTLSEFKRERESDLHGRFYFNCPIAPMCKDEPWIV